MDVKLSPQMRIVALGGVVLLVAVIGLKLVVLKAHNPPAVVFIPSPVHHHVRHVQVHHGAHTAPRPQVDPTLPAALRQALVHHGVVVAVLYVPRNPEDNDAVQAARKGAQDAHVGFAALNVSNEAVATAMALKLPGSSDPSVVIVRRPGTIAALLNGYTDSEVVAQVARDAR